MGYGQLCVDRGGASCCEYEVVATTKPEKSQDWCRAHSGGEKGVEGQRVNFRCCPSVRPTFVSWEEPQRCQDVNKAATYAYVCRFTAQRNQELALVAGGKKGRGGIVGGEQKTDDLARRWRGGNQVVRQIRQGRAETRGSIFFLSSTSSSLDLVRDRHKAHPVKLSILTLTKTRPMHQC